MKNFEFKNLETEELSKDQANEIDGGIIPILLAGAAIGAAGMWIYKEYFE
jgi:hypothetical protein